MLPTVAPVAGGLLAGMYAEALKDLAGLAGGDQIKIWRMQRFTELYANAQRKLRDRGIEPVEPSPDIGLRIIEEAIPQTRPEIQELWEELLAAAMDTSRSSDVRKEFIDIIRDMNPDDALTFKTAIELVRTKGYGTTFTVTYGDASTKHGRRWTSFAASTFHLDRLGLFFEKNNPAANKLFPPVITALGYEFAAAVNIK